MVKIWIAVCEQLETRGTILVRDEVVAEVSETFLVSAKLFQLFK